MAESLDNIEVKPYPPPINGTLIPTTLTIPAIKFALLPAFVIAKCVPSVGLKLHDEEYTVEELVYIVKSPLKLFVGFAEI